MAISNIAAFAHLTEPDIEALAAELDSIRADVEESLGERDARYIRRTIAAQRGLEGRAGSCWQLVRNAGRGGRER